MALMSVEESTEREEVSMRVPSKSLSTIGAVLVVGITLAACGSSSPSTTPSTTGSSAAIPQIDAAAFTADFSLMKQLTGLVAQGQGMIGVLLPDTTTSTRYVQYDAPYLTQAFEAAGLSSDQFKVDNAQGSASTMQTQAEADINAGASVLLVDPLDAGSGAAIESMAEAAGAKVIDYDRLVTGGPEDRFYVSFDNVSVGKLIGQGEVDCIGAWNVTDPNILIMDGDPTDNNAKLFAEGYKSVLQPHFDDNSYTLVGEPAGTWDPPTAATNFEQQFTAHPNINAVVTPNDDNANAVIAVLQKNNIPAKTFPTTGQDASLPGLQNILKGYQCGTVYKPIYLEAQAAAALAIYLRAGVTPPSSLVNATTADSVLGKDIASVYTTPIWVTTENMADTVVKDGAVKVADLCAGDVASACQAAGIS
jgi:D-xylose transport system substrate-binding protein